MRVPANTDRNCFNDEWLTKRMIASPCVGYPSSFHVLDVLEHELDGIYGCLTRDEDHWIASELRQRGV